MKTLALTIAICTLLNACSTSPERAPEDVVQRVGDNVWNSTLLQVEREIGLTTREILREQKRGKQTDSRSWPPQRIW